MAVIYGLPEERSQQHIVDCSTTSFRKMEHLMGGYNSGRHGGGPTVESALKVGVYAALCEANDRPGIGRVNCFEWSNTYSGEVIARVTTIACNLDDEGDAHVKFCHHSGPREVEDVYRVRLKRTDQPFGGRRWWFVCPYTGCRVASLYLPNGAQRFGSAAAYKLAYQSQRATLRDRAIARAHKIRRRLGADVNPLVDVEKPHRMRWATFDREMARLDDAERCANEHLWRAVEALKARIAA